MTDMNGAGAEAFTELLEISRLTRFPEQEAEGRERLIRFLDTYGASTPELPIVDSLCARFGLYPYMSVAYTPDEVAALAVEYHTPPQLAQQQFTFHSEQQRVYERLMDGENVILSAPTSFGKSVVVDALVAAEKWRTIVIIVPTIALMDETRRRLVGLKSRYSVITHPTQERAKWSIFVMTQERFIEIEEAPPVEFFMIDEFYKLGSAEKEDSRRSLLNIVWKQLRQTGAQYYLTGPNIDTLSADIDEPLLESLVTTRFKTVVVEMDDRSHIPEGEAQLNDLRALLDQESESPNLIFVGSPKKAANLAAQISGTTATGRAADLADWVSESYHPEWHVIDALRRGTGIHTGPLPRSLQRAMVRLFQNGEIRTLICTSTLIEGVNTVAKNVIIFEKAIDRKPLDFFTFSNIRGRAGRMFKHFVGRVITYSKPPESADTEVDIPIESQSELAALSTLVQIPEEDLTHESRQRLSHILDQNKISIETIRQNKGIDPGRVIAAAESIHNSTDTERETFSWTGLPTSAEARAVLAMGFDTLLQPRQRRGMNFEMLWGKLQAARRASGNTREMIELQLPYKRPGQTNSDIVEDVLQFQRNWMGFTVPAMLRGMQSIQAELLPRYGIRAGNYEYYLREIEGLHMPQNVASLEEYGLPLPVAEKLIPFGLRGESVQAVLDSLLELSRSADVRVELNSIDLWFIDDVVDGLT